MSVNNKKAVVLGEFEALTHEDVTTGLQELGVSVVDEVNRAVDFVVIGENPDDKALKKARAYGIPVLERWQYDALLDGGDLSELVELGNRGPRVFEKGATVKVVSGPDAVGMIGEIFWWGNSKYGRGMRAGIEGVDGEKYWIDEEHLGWPDDEIQKPDEVRLGKGVTAKVVSGEHLGAKGEIFWWGESKYGDGMRAGIEDESGETIWVDEHDLEPVQ